MEVRTLKNLLKYNPKYGNQKKSKSLINYTISFVIILLSIYFLKFFIDFKLLILYITFEVFSSSINVGNRVISKSFGGIYENLLCSVLTIKDIIMLELMTFYFKDLIGILIRQTLLVIAALFIKRCTVDLLTLCIVLFVIMPLFLLFLEALTVEYSLISKNAPNILNMLSFPIIIVIIFMANTYVFLIALLAILFTLSLITFFKINSENAKNIYN